MDGEYNAKKILALIIIIVLATILVIGLLPYRSALFGAIIMYFLLRPLYVRFAKKMKQEKAAVLTIIIAALIILLPVSLAITMIVNQAGSVIRSAQDLPHYIDQLNYSYPQLAIQERANELITGAGRLIQGVLLNALGSATTALINITILFFILFYLLINSKKIPKQIELIIPFSKKNNKLLVDELGNATNSAIISTGLIALLQGFLLFIGCWIAGVSNPVFWGFIGIFLSFLPVIGPWFIWLPASIILLAQQHWAGGIFLFIWGIVLSNVDNFIRPQLQQRFGKMHPLISLIGVFIGLPLFGILGLIIGPLLLSWFFLTLHMFKEEYLV